MNSEHDLDVVNHMYRLCLTAADTTPARVGRDALRTLWRNHLNCHGDLLRLQESVEGLEGVLWNVGTYLSYEIEEILQETTWDALRLHDETVNLVARDILRAQYDVAYEMAALCFCGDGKSAAWGLARETLDAAHEAGCKVADLPRLSSEIKALLADMTEVPTAQTVECYAAELLYKAAQYGTGGAAQVKALAATLKPAIACGCLVAALEGGVMLCDTPTAD